MSQEFSTEFEQYLNPAFWSGHMLGDGDAIENRDYGMYGYQDRPSIKHSRQVLHETLPQMQAFLPIQRFEPGMLFDAAEHPTGTVVAYKRHDLMHISKKTADAINKDKESIDTRVEPSLDLNFSEYEGSPKIIVENELLYTVKTLWGVVSRNRSNEPTLVSFSHSWVHRESSSSMFIGMRDYRDQKPHFRVGETTHRQLNSEETLEKISKLYVCGYGKTKKARKTATQLVGSLIPRPVLSSPSLGLSQETI